METYKIVHKSKNGCIIKHPINGNVEIPWDVFKEMFTISDKDKFTCIKKEVPKEIQDKADLLNKKVSDFIPVYFMNKMHINCNAKSAFILGTWTEETAKECNVTTAVVIEILNIHLKQYNRYFISK